MKQSAENWLAEVKLERQARRLARSVARSLIADGSPPRREDFPAAKSNRPSRIRNWISKIFKAH